ncbi:MAG: hypothetical protein NT165_01720 [Candidatus Falkowbacteria bacterium]|nr:hypothetical protein [Candidatus Falkowbacteria bacterium]
MENKPESKAPKETGKKNNRFFASAGVIFVTVIMVTLWCLNLPHLFSGDFKLPEKKEDPVDLQKVRSDLDLILENTGKHFEEMRDREGKVTEAENLLNKINISASSSLATTSSQEKDKNPTSTNLKK